VQKLIIMNKQINFAVIGCGHIGARHAEMVLRNDSCALSAIIDIKAKEDLKAISQDVPYFTSVADFFNSDIAKHVDVINIATPNGLHAEHALLALEHGKHVVIEKPMALNKQDAERIMFTALQKQKLVFCVMQNRYSPPSAWIKELLAQGKLGDIYMVQLNCYWNRDHRYYTAGSWHGDLQLDGGTLFTQFSHFIDLMYWLFGDIKNIKSKFANFNHQALTQLKEDSGNITFEFLNGALGTLNFSTSIWNQNLESSMTIIAQNGSVKIGGQYMDKVEVCNIKDYTMPELAPTNAGNDYGAYKGSAANHHYVIDNVVEVLQGNNAITTNALEGLKVVDIIERMYSATS
jgi:UDP-N-acetyl-2-amino-2-deoxyglucuronate dehydrogenase